ncbi:hypothetical protein RJT34_16803 [Clitoria ternatea]|uniref:Uncharacterized protein n=1 Tax=Clitoria ternatea TaxID=43366 RepID=A0AAN9J8Z9_CLITE
MYGICRGDLFVYVFQRSPRWLMRPIVAHLALLLLGLLFNFSPENHISPLIYCMGIKPHQDDVVHVDRHVNNHVIGKTYKSI